MFSLYSIALFKKLDNQTQGLREGGGGGGELPRAPTLIGPQLESEGLKLSRFFKLIRAF